MESYFISKGLAPDISANIASLFKKRNFKRGELFLKEGTINNHLIFITSGLVQYYYNLDGREKTTYIAGANSFVISLKSYFRDIPSQENIRALTKVECYLISKSNLEKIIESNYEFRSFYVSMLGETMICLDESRLQTITLTAEQRYQLILKSEPGLVNQVPLQYLASMLGVTPRHLSRIRAEIQ